MIRFTLTLLLTAAALAGVVLLALEQQWMAALPSFFYQTLIFLLFSTILLYAYLYRAEKPGFFVQLYLLTMVVKLAAYLAYNLFVVLEDRAGATLNVVFFLGVYVVFTTLEIAFLYRKITH